MPTYNPFNQKDKGIMGVKIPGVTVPGIAPPVPNTPFNPNNNLKLPKPGFDNPLNTEQANLFEPDEVADDSALVGRDIDRIRKAQNKARAEGLAGQDVLKKAGQQGPGNAALQVGNQESLGKKLSNAIDPEFLRMMFDRNTLDKLKTTSVRETVDAPQMAVRTPQGDLLSKTQGIQQATNQINRRPMSADAQLNAVSANLQNQALANQTAQLGLSDAQMYRQSQAQADTALAQNEQSRINAINQNNALYAAKVNADIAAKNKQIQYKDQALSTYWATKNAERQKQKDEQALRRKQYGQQMGNAALLDKSAALATDKQTLTTLVSNLANDFEIEYNKHMEEMKIKNPAAYEKNSKDPNYKTQLAQNYKTAAESFYRDQYNKLNSMEAKYQLAKAKFEAGKPDLVAAYEQAGNDPFKLDDAVNMGVHRFTPNWTIPTMAKGGVVDAYFKSLMQDAKEYNKGEREYNKEFAKSRREFAKLQVAKFRKSR